MTRRRAAFPSFAFLLNALLEIFVITLFIVTFVFAPLRIPSGSMEPTLRVGDFVLADLQSFAPEGRFAWLLPPSTVHRGALAVFHFPRDPRLDLVKRVIGLPGDRIRLSGGHVFINDRPLAEPYAFYTPAAGFDSFRDDFPSLRATDPDVDPAWWVALRPLIHNGVITVPPGNYFMLGDNRDQSDDSRYWGFVPRQDLIARPLVVYLATPPAAVTGLGRRLRFARRGFHLLH